VRIFKKLLHVFIIHAAVFFENCGKQLLSFAYTAKMFVMTQYSHHAIMN